MNNITLKGVKPTYFIPRSIENSQIWNKEIQFEKGNSYLIIAPSGSGKSTLASAILGNHFHYQGTIMYDNVTVEGLSLEQLVSHRKNGLQLLFQDVRLIPELTLRENVMLRLFGKTSPEADQRLLDLATTLGIAPLLDKKAKNCSYGERQRAAIVRSLINPADFLLYDECFSHLDADNKAKAFHLIRETAAISGSAIVFFELNDFEFSHHCNTYNL